MIPPAAARWIHDVVLPPGLRDDIRDGLREHCACQWGPCGHCQASRHHQCSIVAWGGAPRTHCDTYITNARGQVAVGRGVSADVWRSGRPCRWICPCGCTPIGAMPPPPEQCAVEQLDLFAALPIGAMRP